MVRSNTGNDLCLNGLFAGTKGIYECKLQLHSGWVIK